MSWDAFQRGVLAELGHVLYVPRHADAQETMRQMPVMAGEVDGAMLARLARAAGVDRDALQAHADIVAMTGALHGDAAAKRALWPRLRGLRRTRG